LNFNWFESFIFGLISGISDVLPVSAQAHKAILLKIFGAGGEDPAMRLVIHLAALGALYYGCSNHIMRILRQRRLSKIPKKKRKRPVDTRTLMEYKLLIFIAVPVILSFFFYEMTTKWDYSLNMMAIFMLLNAAILFLPSLVATANKDARSMSSLDGVLMGFGGALAIIPGVSSVATITSIASIRGAERTFALNLTYLIQMLITAGLIVFDFVAIGNAGKFIFSFGILFCYLMAAVGSFVATFLGMKVMRTLAVNIGYRGFAFYSLGAALFSFILYLMV
jgi:undecaprenyl-diphosphatase